MTYCNRFTPDRTCIEEYQDDLFYYLSNLFKPEDTLIYLGDLACSREKSLEGCKKYLNLLKCEKHFIRGNHDNWLSNEDILSLGFKSCRDYIRIDNTLICHYSLDVPYGTFGQYKRHEYLWNLFYENPNIHKIYHGHNHNSPLRGSERVDGKTIIRKNSPKGEILMEYVNCCIDKIPYEFNVVEFKDYHSDTLKNILRSNKCEFVTENFKHTQDIQNSDANPVGLNSDTKIENLNIWNNQRI